MSLYEFQCYASAWIKANGGGDAPPTAEEFDALQEKYRHLD